MKGIVRANPGQPEDLGVNQQAIDSFAIPRFKSRPQCHVVQETLASNQSRIISTRHTARLTPLRIGNFFPRLVRIPGTSLLIQVGMRKLNNGDPIKYNDNNEKTWLFLMIYTRDRPTLTLFSSQLSTLSYSCEIYMKSKNKIYLCTFICINLIYPI
jgi:hypothetical protein